MEQIFRTARLKEEYNLIVQRDEKGDLHVTVDNGNTGRTIVLNGLEVTGLTAGIAALAPTPTDKPETPGDGIPPYEPSSCGTAYLASERALRIIEHATQLGEAMSSDAIERITDLAHEAGAACNRVALHRNALAHDLPF